MTYLENFMQHHDVLIAGSGIVGATLALSLLKAGMRVGLIETLPITAPSQNHEKMTIDAIDLRVFALTRASERIFRHLSIWDNMVAAGISPFRQMHVWDAGGQGEIHFDCSDITEPTLGYIVEQRVIQTGLLAALQHYNSLLTWYRPAKIQQFALTPDATAMQVQLNNNNQLTTRLLISAEGANSSIRSAAGIPYTMHDYAQQAIVATIHTEFPHQETAWQRFLPTGPLAFLPLANHHYCSIVWSVDTPIAQKLIALPKQEFLTQLEQAIAGQLGQIINCSERALFPLKRGHAHHYVQSRLALIGDAAHSVHPLAGQGVNLGLLDVASLSEVVIKAHRLGKDFGHIHILKRHERWRKTNTLTVMTAMDGFKYLFGNQQPALSWLRNQGLIVTNALPLVKKTLMRHAMGLSGDLPPMAK